MDIDTAIPIVIGVLVALVVLALLLIVLQRKRRAGTVLANRPREDGR